MINIKIRKGNSNDLEIIQELSDELAISDLPFDKEVNTRWAHGDDGKKYYKDKLSEKDGICFVAELEKEIVGYVTGSQRKPSSWRKITLVELDNLYIKEKHRSNGIGKLLVDRFIRWEKEQSADRIVVSAFYPNDRAVAFYKREGFLPYDINLELHLSTKLQADTPRSE